MASNLKDAILEVASSNTYFFPDSRLDDFIIRTTDPTQRILLGTACNVAARLTITSNNTYAQGNVGFGVSNPTYAVDVAGDVNFSGMLRQGGNPYISSQFTSIDSNVALLGTSNLGVGVSNPAYKLDVAGDVNFSGVLRQGGNAYISSQLSNVGSNVALLGNSNLGIGVSNPAYKLDVAGDVNFSGMLRQGGNPYISSQWSNLPSSNIAYTQGGVSVNTTSVLAPLTVGGGVCILRSGINTIAGSNTANPVSTGGVSVNAIQVFDTSNWVAVNNQSSVFTVGNGAKHLSISLQCYTTAANVVASSWYHIHNATTSNVVHTNSIRLYFNLASVHHSMSATRILTSNVLPTGSYFMRLGLSNATADPNDFLTATLIDFS